jgi:hypothetical protein
MTYRSVVHDLREYLGGVTTSPDSVIQSPIPLKHIVVGGLQPWLPKYDNLQVILKEVVGIANPYWLRDTWTIGVQVIGEDRGNYMECESLIGDVIYSLVGSNTLYIEDRAYVQITSNQLPQFVGYLDNSRPVFSATLNFVVEGLTDEYNRKALC